ncbi:vomeronasal type-1 receptor 4-like [Tupaia chinensis]|uniref:vomeronasal type-1 receptor 4-like n=1 Tax=Tupaia chinensis TaxID=246437 RepID=UPI0003C8FCFB|nr:vomeronasal type-1 receptor 4-like [Tupaia chinensis]
MLAALGLRDFLSDAGCKLVFYLYRVGRDVSMGTICLLSVFQLITISPVNSKWAKLKVKAPKFLCACSVLCWALSLLFNSVVPVYVTARSDNRNITGKSDLGYCYVAHIEQTRRSMYIASVFFRDGLCLVLMTWANIFMVYILHRHKKRVQYLHTRNLSARASPEDTATQSIFVLVSTFVTLYALSSTFHMLLTFIDSSNLWLLKASIIISGFFPALDPYIILYYDSRVPRRCLSWIRTTKNPRLITNL